jgi:hypothetical protein
VRRRAARAEVVCERVHRDEAEEEGEEDGGLFEGG